MIIKIFLVILGLIIGYKHRASIIYIFFVLIAFSDLQYLKFVNIGPATIYIYLCIIPSLLYLLLDFVQSKNPNQKIFKYYFILTILFFLYILTRFNISMYEDKVNLLKALTSGFIIFLFVIYNINKINMATMIKLCRYIIIIEAIIVIAKYFGIDSERILFMFDFTQIASKNVELLNIVRATGTFYDPNYFAFYMSILVAVILRVTRGSIWNSFIFLLGIIAIILSFSRMGILIASILLLIFIFYKFRINSPLKIALTFFTCSICILTALYFIYNKPALFEYILARFNTDYDWYAGGRLFIWKTYFYEILNIKNSLLGLGFENFQFYLAQITGYELAAHNEYIQIFADLGMVGILFVSSYAIIIKKFSNHKLDFKNNPMLFPFFTALIGNLFLTTTFNIYTFFYYAAFLGYLNVDNKEITLLK